MDRIPKPGEFYRHFKDKLYQIVALAEHSETGETLVVYQALYGDFRTYARPLSMFTSEVDREKYPDVSQQYRFERVKFVRDGNTNRDASGQEAGDATRQEAGSFAAAGHSGSAEIQEEEESEPLNPLILSFIEAETYEARMEILRSMRGKVSQDDLGIIYVALDMKRVEGTVDAQLEAVEQILGMQRHYDGGHLR